MEGGRISASPIKKGTIRGRGKAGEREYEVDNEVFAYCRYHGKEYVHGQEQWDEVRRRLHCSGCKLGRCGKRDLHYMWGVLRISPHEAQSDDGLNTSFERHS